MWFEIDANGISVRLQINGYEPASEHNWHKQWCKCNFSFSSGDWLDYHSENDEILLSAEVEGLEKALTELLDNNLSETKEIKFAEPDFVFKLHPQTDLRNNPNHIYICPGYEIQDIYLEWKVYFYDNGPKNNHLVIILTRNELVVFRDYLAQVINRKLPIY